MLRDKWRVAGFDMVNEPYTSGVDILNSLFLAIFLNDLFLYKFCRAKEFWRIYCDNNIIKNSVRGIVSKYCKENLTLD